MRITVGDVLMEDESDVYDYLTKGILPSGKDRDILMRKLAEGDYSDIVADKDQTSKNIDVIYKNLKRNAAITLGAIGVSFAAGAKCGSAATNRRYTKEEKKKK